MSDNFPRAAGVFPQAAGGMPRAGWDRPGWDRFCVLLLGVLFAGFTAPACLAQQARVSTPMHGVGDSFYEQIGVSWGGRFGGRNGGGFFNFGGPNPGLPPFGGNDPNANARFGFGRSGGGGGFWFGGVAGQGSNRSLISRTPTVVIPNGGIGSVANVLQRPFVTGLVPVVGQRNLSPLLERLERLKQQGTPVGTRPSASDGDASGSAATLADGTEQTHEAAGSLQPSTASRGDLSVAEIRRQRELDTHREALEQQRELDELIQRGRSCEADGKFGAARIYYRRAASLADGSLGDQLRTRADQLPR